MNPAITKKLLMAFVYSSICSLGVTTYANDHVLPEFSNSYYVTATRIFTLATCGKTAWEYSGQYDTEDELVKAELGNVQPHPGVCIWGKPYKKGVETNIYDGFIGNDDDFTAISAQYPADIWERDCRVSSGLLATSKTVTAHPFFHCPVGSISAETADGISGCSKVAFCPGDVLARDLDQFPLGALGHVGLVFPFSLGSVIEVLNDAQVIHVGTNTIINSFTKHPSSSGGFTKYWGDKYGIIPNFTVEQLTSITNAAFDQTDFPSPIYTTTAEDGPYGHPAIAQKVPVFNQKNKLWENEIKPDQARFRCDTFVNYLYHKGTGIAMPNPTSLPILPTSTYDSFPQLRNGIASLIRQKTNLLIGSKLQSTVTLKYYFTDYLNNKEVDISALDQLITPLLHKKIQRTDNINFLWDLAKNNINSPKKFNYLIDVLMVLEPIEISQPIINFYRAQNLNVSQKQKLLALLYCCAQNNNKQTYEKNIQSIQNFFIKQLASTSPIVRKEAIIGYSLIFPSEEAFPMLMTQLSTKKDSNNIIIYKQLVWLAFANGNTEEKLLPQLLKNTTQYTPEQRIQSINLLSTIINYFYEHNLENFSPITRQRILQFLAEQTKILTPRNKQVSFMAAYNFYQTLKAESYLLQNNTNINKTLASKLKNMQNQAMSFLIMSFVPNKVIQLLSTKNTASPHYKKEFNEKDFSNLIAYNYAIIGRFRLLNI